MSFKTFNFYLISLSWELFKNIIYKVSWDTPSSDLSNRCILEFTFSIRSYIKVSDKAARLVEVFILVQNYRVLFNCLMRAWKWVSNPNLSSDDKVHFRRFLILFINNFSFFKYSGLESKTHLFKKRWILVFVSVEKLSIVMINISKQIFHWWR